MKKITFFIAAVLLISSCSKIEKQELPYDSFEYSFSAQALDYSIKFNSSDTVYFIKRRPEPASYSYAIIDKKQKDNLIALVKDIDFSKYKSTYEDMSIMDASAFTLSKTKDGKKETVHVYGTKAPEALYRYAAKLNEHIKHLNFQPYKVE